MSTNSLDRLHGFDGGFTVLMAVYYKEDPLRFKRALVSVFSNTLVPDSMILVVDGPIPQSIDHIIIDTLRSHNNIQVYRLPENRGLAYALNEGLSHVKTEWVVRADSDDINRPGRFETQAKAIAMMIPPVDLLGGAIQEMDFDGTPLGVRRTVEMDSDIRLFARRRSPFNHMTIAYRTSLVRSVGGYPDIYLKEDYALWASMIHAGARCANLPDILVDAMTGREMYYRRGGLKYAIAEISLQRHLITCNIKSSSHAIIDGVARSLVFMMPAFFRALFYTIMLRK